MRTPKMEPTIKSIEESIHFLRSLIGSDVANIRPTVIIDKNTYKRKLDNIGFEYYITWADRHYFVSRTLFMNYVFDYSYFSAFQCIENYLKAFIKSKKTKPTSNTHTCKITSNMH